MKKHLLKSEETQQTWVFLLDFDPANWMSKGLYTLKIIWSFKCNLHFLHHLRINPNQKPWQGEHQKEDTAEDCEVHLLRTASDGKVLVACGSSANQASIQDDLKVVPTSMETAEDFFGTAFFEVPETHVVTLPRQIWHVKCYRCHRSLLLTQSPRNNGWRMWEGMGADFSWEIGHSRKRLRFNFNYCTKQADSFREGHAIMLGQSSFLQLVDPAGSPC